VGTHGLSISSMIEQGGNVSLDPTRSRYIYLHVVTIYAKIYSIDFFKVPIARKNVYVQIKT